MSYKTFLWMALMGLASNSGFSSDIKIVTVGSAEQAVLSHKTEDIQAHEFPLAREIAQKLFAAITPYLPAAGLAAPQININKSVFIFSFDRDPKNLEVVINPSFEPIGDTIFAGWEACFSVILSTNTWEIAKIPRYEAIKVAYYNLEGERIEKKLEGFAATAFQHEYDHLQGIKNIDRKNATLKSFHSKEELTAFMQAVKKEDAARYRKPD